VCSWSHLAFDIINKTQQMKCSPIYIASEHIHVMPIRHVHPLNHTPPPYLWCWSHSCSVCLLCFQSLHFCHSVRHGCGGGGLCVVGTFPFGSYKEREQIRQSRVGQVCPRRNWMTNINWIVLCEHNTQNAVHQHCFRAMAFRVWSSISGGVGGYRLLPITPLTPFIR